MDNQAKRPANRAQTPGMRQHRGQNASAARKKVLELPEDYPQWLDGRMFDDDENEPQEAQA